MDSCSSFTVISADLTNIIKEWMERSWGDNIAYVTGCLMHPPEVPHPDAPLDTLTYAYITITIDYH